MKRLAHCLILLALLIAPQLRADILKLGNGKILEGIVQEQGDFLIVQTDSVRQTLPVDTVVERVEETPLQYHFRLAAREIDNNQLAAAEARLREMRLLGADADSVSEFGEEIQFRQKILAEKGKAALEKYLTFSNTLQSAMAKRQIGDLEGALRDFLACHKFNPKNPTVIENLAEIYFERMVRDLMTRERAAELREQAATFSGAPRIEFVPAQESDPSAALTEADALMVPLRHVTKVPDRLSALRQLYRKNANLYLALHHTFLLERLTNGAAHFEDPSLNQWATLARLIERRREKTREAARALSKAEADAIYEDLARQAREQREFEIDRLYKLIQRMARLKQFNREMLMRIDRFKSLNPPKEFVDAVTQYEMLARQYTTSGDRLVGESDYLPGAQRDIGSTWNY